MNISRNTNSRNRRKMINGFKGEGTPSGWVKTSPYGTIEYKPTLDDIRHSNKVKKFYADKYKGVNPKNSNSWTGKHTFIVDFESHIITIYDDYVE